jgi:epsilon-lactone hydrolase
LIHFHGGAYRIGAPEVVAPFAAVTAAHRAVRVLCPAYRLAPEPRFPAALIDGLAVIDGSADAHRFSLFLSGDSAGGGLAATSATIGVSQRRQIRGSVLLSAWRDLTVTNESFITNAATDSLFSRAAAMDALSTGRVRATPLASPLLACLEGFPTTLINVGAGEVLADDSIRMHAKLEDAGIEARLCVIPSMEHVAVTRDLAVPGAAVTFAAVADFIDEHLAPAP